MMKGERDKNEKERKQCNDRKDSEVIKLLPKRLSKEEISGMIQIKRAVMEPVLRKNARNQAGRDVSSSHILDTHEG